VSAPSAADIDLNVRETTRAERRRAGNPCEAINGWCTRCGEWTVRGPREECRWCDKPLLDRPGGERL
jgi:hypothetical protein